MAKIDIIIPVYNAEKYIRNCLDSVLKQSFQDFRIIVVDDKSTDRSLEILRVYAKELPDKMLLIELPINQGVSNARNVALEISDSEYVAFLDSDDIYAKDILAKVNAVIEKYNPDMVTIELQFNLLGLNGDFLGMKHPNKKSRLIIPEEYKTHIYEERPNVTTKFIKRECIHTKFPVGLKWEDYAFSIPYLATVRSIYTFDEIGYFYTINPFGTTTTDIFKIPTRVLDIFEASDCINGALSKEVLEYYKEELRVVRTMNCLQRVRDLSLATNATLEEKADLANALIQLIRIREGDHRDLELYHYQKANSLFYRLRMNFVESLVDERYAHVTNEDELKAKILTMTKKYEKKSK